MIKNNMDKCKKITIILPVLFIILLFSINAEASFSVPSEIKIKTDNSLKSYKKITITNPNDNTINISCFLEKTYKDYLKENRTLLPDFSWIKITPEWQKIEPNQKEFFEIAVDIPPDEENFYQKWQVWLTFKSEGGTFSVEHSSNLLIDTTKYNPDSTPDLEIIEIDMKTGFIHGNTTKKISLTNSYGEEITVETLFEHPNIFSKKNYSNIPNLSWISTNPTNANIKPGETKNFYIYIDPEEKEEYSNKIWETILVFNACFKDNPDNCVELEPQPRIILRTPDELTVSNDDTEMKGVSTDPPGVPPNGLLLLLLVLFFIVLTLFFVYKKKDKK
jgi:hypothetical protein